jgi:hypothetical protein
LEKILPGKWNRGTCTVFDSLLILKVEMVHKAGCQLWSKLLAFDEAGKLLHLPGPVGQSHVFHTLSSLIARSDYSDGTRIAAAQPILVRGWGSPKRSIRPNLIHMRKHLRTQSDTAGGNYTKPHHIISGFCRHPSIKRETY